MPQSSPEGINQLEFVINSISHSRCSVRRVTWMCAIAIFQDTFFSVVMNARLLASDQEYNVGCVRW